MKSKYMYPEYYIVVKEDMSVIDEEGNDVRLEPGEVYEIRTLYGGQEVVVVDDIDYDIVLEPEDEDELYVTLDIECEHGYIYKYNGVYFVVEYGYDYKTPFDTIKEAYTYLKEGVVKYYDYKLIDVKGGVPLWVVRGRRVYILRDVLVSEIMMVQAVVIMSTIVTLKIRK